MILLAIVLVTGCARPPVVPEAPSAARICCKSLADIPTSSLQFDEPRFVAFDRETSPAYAFPEGNGVFAAFQLPERADGATLDLRAFISSGTLLSMATIFKPNAMFLDGHFRPLPGAHEAPLQVYGGLLALRMSRLASFKVPSGAAYAVVYSGSPRSQRVVIQSENGTLYGIPYSYTGDVEVALRRVK